MFNKFNVKPLWEVSKKIVAVSQGYQSADIVITNAKLINVCTREVIDNTDVAISEGRIALVGDAKHCVGEGTEVIDAKGQYIAPGFLDGHIHVESSMLSVSEYARSVAVSYTHLKPSISIDGLCYFTLKLPFSSFILILSIFRSLSILFI